MKKIHPLLIFAVMVICMIIIFSWIVEIKQGNMPLFDQWNRKYVPLFEGTAIYTMFSYITKLGSKSFLLPATIVLMGVFLMWYKDFQPAVMFGAGVLGAHLLNKLIKGLVERERPSISAILDAVGYSFPSGHSMVSIVFYSLAAYFISIKCNSRIMSLGIWVISGLFILFIGMSRYILNVHFLTDILSGYFIGLLLLFIFIFLYSRFALGKNSVIGNDK